VFYGIDYKMCFFLLQVAIMIGSSVFTLLCRKFTVESFMRLVLFLLPEQDALPCQAFCKMSLAFSYTFVLQVHVVVYNCMSLLLWPPCVIGGPLYFCPVVSFFLPSFLLSSFFSSPNLSGHRLDVYHTSPHGVALVRI